MARVRWASEELDLSPAPLARARVARARDARTRVEAEEAPVPVGGGEASDWLWRHRRETAPVWGVLALVAIATLGHELAASTPLDAAFIVPSVALLVMLRLRGERERAFVARCMAPAILWTCSAWWVGLGDPVVLGGLLVGGPVAVVAWRLVHRHSSIEVIHENDWPWTWSAWRFSRRAERELTNVASIWPWVAKRSGIPGAELHLSVAHFEDGYSLHVDLPRGRVGRDIQTDRLASALREFPVGPILTPDPARPWRVVITERRPEVDE